MVAELFLRLREALEQSRVPYMLTGSFASSVHGTPRATQDIDIVISPTRPQLLELLDHFPEEKYYVSREAAIEALLHRTQFNVIDFATGWKIDFILRKARPFSAEEFKRRSVVEAEGVSLDVASAEDMVLSKLEWAKAGQSNRQIEDAAGILRMQGNNLDLSYIALWIEALGLQEQWKEATSRAAQFTR